METTNVRIFLRQQGFEWKNDVFQKEFDNCIFYFLGYRLNDVEYLIISKEKNKQLARHCRNYIDQRIISRKDTDEIGLVLNNLRNYFIRLGCDGVYKDGLYYKYLNSKTVIGYSEKYCVKSSEIIDNKRFQIDYKKIHAEIQYFDKNLVKIAYYINDESILDTMYWHELTDYNIARKLGLILSDFYKLNTDAVIKLFGDLCKNITRICSIAYNEYVKEDISMYPHAYSTYIEQLDIHIYGGTKEECIENKNKVLEMIK